MDSNLKKEDLDRINPSSLSATPRQAGLSGDSGLRLEGASPQAEKNPINPVNPVKLKSIKIEHSFKT